MRLNISLQLCLNTERISQSPGLCLQPQKSKSQYQPRVYLKLSQASCDLSLHLPLLNLMPPNSPILLYYASYIPRFWPPRGQLVPLRLPTTFYSHLQPQNPTIAHASYLCQLWPAVLRSHLQPQLLSRANRSHLQSQLTSAAFNSPNTLFCLDFNIAQFTLEKLPHAVRNIRTAAPLLFLMDGAVMRSGSRFNISHRKIDIMHVFAWLLKQPNPISLSTNDTGISWVVTFML